MRHFSVVRLIIVAGFLIVMLGTYYLYGVSRQLSWWGQQSPIPQGLLAAGIMLAGIFLGSLFRQIRRKVGKVNIIREFIDVLSASTFWAALCVSPLVFFSVFAVTGDNPATVSTYVLAFENGFFCEAVFKELFEHRLQESK